MNLAKLVRLPALLLCAVSFSATAMDIDLFMTDNEANTSPANVLFMLDNSANWGATLYKLNGQSVTKLDVISESLYTALTDPANTDSIATGYSQFTSKSGGKIMAAVKLLSSSYQRTLGSKIYSALPWTPGTSLVRTKSGSKYVPIYVLPNYSSDPTIAPNHWNSHYYSVTTDGTTGSTEPTWPTNGGTVTSGSVVFTDMGLVYGATAIQALTQANGSSYALTMYEDYLYFRGDAPLNGLVDPDYDHSAVSGSNYVSPNANETCEKNFIVLIGSGKPDSGENNTAYSYLSNLYKTYGVSGNPTVLPLNPNYSAGNWGDEYAGFLNSTADSNKTESGKQPITTYVIAVYDPTVAFSSLTPVDQGAIVFLQNIANQGKGRYFQAGNTDQFSKALKAIFTEVKAVNSVFASTTLPVSINVRGTNLNQVYMGVFRPDANKLVDWYGNLKMYKLGYDQSTGAIYLADSTGTRADSAVTGFIVNSAASFWTHRTDSSVYQVSGTGQTQWWWWRPQGVGADSDYVDGDLVEKGGAGQWLREHPQSRVLYTCHTCDSSTALQTFDTTHVTATDLGVNSTDAAATVNFIIGNNAVGDGPEKVRSMVHGDVLHSRPATINYGPGSDDVVTYYGANDGVFHAVKGGESAASWGYSVGQELWGFVPPEVYTGLPKLYYNQSISGSNPKPFFVDGTIASLTWGGKNYVYLTMRRGARAIYALNVADNLKQAPQIAWHLNNTNLPELGQTWSDPTLYLANMGGTQTPVIVMGAGYDSAEDVDVTNGTPDAMGRGVYVINALTGSVIRFLGNTSGGQTGAYAAVVDSIPGGIKSAGDIDKTTGMQLLTTAYAADTGGNIWKLDFTSSDVTNWSMTKIASLGGTGSANRKFLYMPDVVNRPTLGYSAVMVGSGDREHPMDTSVQNYFFMVKDYYDSTKNVWPLTITQLPDASVAGNYTGVEPGWRFPLKGSGEKDVGTSVTMAGVVYFNTNVPYGPTWDGNTCTPSLGEARGYAIGLDGSCQTGTGQCYTVAPGGGFLPSPVPFTVEINGTTVTGVISGTQVHKPPPPPYGHTTRQFWYKLNVDK